METKILTAVAASGGDIKDMEVAIIRKRDKNLINVKFFDLLRYFKNADFINDEITINGEVCKLSSFQNKPDLVILSVIKATNGGDGSYIVDGTTYTANHEFQVQKNANVNITLAANVNSAFESVIDSNGASYLPNNNVVTIPVAAALTLTITFKGKNPI